MKENIYTAIEAALLGNPKYKSEDGKILKAVVYSDVMTMNPELLQLLLDNPEITEQFFTDVNGTLVFDKQQFAWLLESKEFLPDSYTRYTNKIGLSYRGEFLSKSNDVVLDFPYKDSLLVGGQDRDEQGRDEIFLHDVIASEEITRLLAPKTLANARKYIQGGGGIPCAKFSDTDNLIVKGNNLIALASLLKRFEGQVKCIYIDPPYNTGKDSFNYNDRFNHSTWLTFMRNRLELAKRLLREDGIIFVHIDRNEFAYLKVLMDEIFGRDNELSTIIWMNKEGGGKSDSKFFRQKHEYILSFTKNQQFASINAQEVEDIERYREEDEYVATRGKYQKVKLDSSSLGWVKSLDYPIEHNGVVYYPGGDKDKWLERQNGGASPKDRRWRWSQSKLEWGIANGFVVFENGNVYTKQYLNCDKDGNITPRTNQPLPVIEKYSTTQSNKHLKSLFGQSIFNYSKPEGLIYELLTWATQQGDLVLDFFLGSGTTAAVAHKMGRRYIGIEQMDYIEEITVARLQKVLDGEQGGISQEVGWTGGGSFVYCELLENSAQLIKKIQEANADTIYKVRKDIYSDHRIVPFLTSSELNEVNQDFQDLRNEGEEGLLKQKELLIRIVDKNKLYVNFSDAKDEDYKVDEADLAFSTSFYSKREGDGK